MPGPRNTRIAVVGAGPAGLATALALHQAEPGLSITVLRAPSDRPRRPVETLPPTIEPWLRKLGVWEDFLTECHRPSYGSSAAWGEAVPRDNDFVFHPFARGWHVDRSRFDHMLANFAEHQGIEIVELSLAEPPARDIRGSWRLPCRSRTSGSVTLEADWIVDASGRSAAVARHLGARFERSDRLIGLAQSFDVPRSAADAKIDARSFVEATESGWWSLTWAPGGVAWVAFMTDDDLAKSANLRSPENWRLRFRETRHLQCRLAGAEPRGNLAVQAAHSGFLNPVAGDRWLAVGDAASCLDPLSSMGVFKALRSGFLASFALRNVLAGDVSGIARYVALHRAEYVRYLEGRARFYAEEVRWPRAEFWRRRRPSTDLLASASYPPRDPHPGASWPEEVPQVPHGIEADGSISRSSGHPPSVRVRSVPGVPR